MDRYPLHFRFETYGLETVGGVSRNTSYGSQLSGLPTAPELRSGGNEISTSCDCRVFGRNGDPMAGCV